MMLGALGIRFRYFGRNAERDKKIHQDAVALLGEKGQLLPFGCKFDRLLARCFNEAGFLQAPHCAKGRDMRDPEMSSYLPYARLALVLNQIVDKLGVILGSFLAVMRPGSFETVRAGAALAA